MLSKLRAVIDLSLLFIERVFCSAESFSCLVPFAKSQLISRDPFSDLFCHLSVSKYCLVLMYDKYFEPHQCYNRENLESLQMIDGVLKVVDIFEFRQTVWWYVYPLLTERIMCKHETDDNDFDDDAPQARQHAEICAQRQLSTRTICGTKREAMLVSSSR